VSKEKITYEISADWLNIRATQPLNSMFIDSHCHLDRLDLSPYQHDFSLFMQQVAAQHIDHLLCVAIDLEAYPAMVALVKDYPMISLSLGVHPNVQLATEPSFAQLLKLV